jgi:iron complex transport system ATP-binding protein
MTAAAPATVALEARGVSVRYGTRPALTDVDVSFRLGELVSLVGPNGSGKTTLIRAALGLVAPSTGTVLLLGEPVERLSIPERARRVAWVPQEERPYDNVRVMEYVLFGRNPHVPAFGSEDAADREMVRDALEAVGMWDRRSDGIHEVSGGERQRVLLARALAQDTPVILLDEPTAHLDVGHQLDLLDRVRALCRSNGKCAIAAIHDLNLAARYSDRMVALSRGRVVAQGPPESVLSEELLGAVWGVAADVRRDPRSGRPYLLPRLPVGLWPGHRDAPGVGLGPVHVVGGGGSAAPALRALVSEGFRVTAGALHMLDTDTEAAEELGVPFAAEAPFAPLSSEVRERNGRLLEAARAVVVAPFWVGPSNLANLEDLLPQAARIPVYLLRGEPMDKRDFTGGRASEVLRELRSRGAVDVEGLPALLDALRVQLRAAAAPPGPRASTGKPL